MASNQTANYGLNQWEPGDQVLRTEFNADNQKIDAALTAASQLHYTVGVLTEYDGTQDVTVTLGVQPAMVMVGNRLGWTNIIGESSGSSYSGSAVALPNTPGYFTGTTGSIGATIALEVTATGFIVHSGFDQELAPFYYLALH